MNRLFNAIFSLRYLAVLAVIGPFLGAVLMLILGTLDIIQAYASALGFNEPEGSADVSKAVVIKIVSSIDHFLFAAFLMIFAVGLFTLFFRTTSNTGGEHDNIKKPSWKHLKNLGGMDEMLLKIIIMLLAVNFLEFVLMSEFVTLEWTALVIPVAIIAMAIGLKLMSDSTDEVPEREESSESTPSQNGPANDQE